jgi:hypothetical protein
MRFTAVLLLIAAIGPQAATVDQPTVTVQGRTYLQLQPEGSVLHVGQLAALSVASNRGFSVTSAGTALVLVKRERQKGNTIYLYRAVEAGSHTFVATPKDPGPDGCVSCVTVHYFVKVRAD